MGWFDAITKLFSGTPADPTTAWIAAALAIITGDGEDPATWDEDDARATLARWWSSEDAAACRARLSALSTDDTWSLLRGVHVARMGLAAGFLTAAESRAIAVSRATALQQAHPSWQHLALAYWEAQRAWAADAGVDVPDAAARQADMGRLHLEIWQGVPFRQPLTP
jgi:hypothetical protein